MDKVTVYITNYNYGKYLKEAIESVLNQSYSNIELIIIDDGSTDNSKSIIDTYAHDYDIKVIYQKNKGLNISNNIALSLATGKYLMRLDADDYLKHNAIEKLVKTLDDNPKFGLVFPDYFIVDEFGNEINVIKRHNFKDVTLHDQPAHGACTLVRISFLRKVGGYYEAFRCQDGYDLWLKFISNFEICNVNEPLFYYRKHGNNLTKDETFILETRSLIQKKFINDNSIKNPNCYGLIPVRSLRNSKLPLAEIDNKTLLQIKIDAALNSELIDEVVVTYSDNEISTIVQNLYADKVQLIKRPDNFSNYNNSLLDTIKLVDKEFNSEGKYDSVNVLSLEYPYIKSSFIDSAIRSAVLFNSDSVISVREINSSLYKHDGKSMKTVVNDSKTKYERDLIYESVGGILFLKLSTLFKSNKIPNGKIGHILINQIGSFKIESEMDLRIGNIIYESAM